jgi:hypothetical protein
MHAFKLMDFLLAADFFLGADFFLDAAFFFGTDFFLGAAFVSVTVFFLGAFLGLEAFLLVVGTDFVGVFDLHNNAIGNHLLQDTQEHGIPPLLIGGESGLHVLLMAMEDEPVGSLSPVMAVMSPAL